MVELTTVGTGERSWWNGNWFSTLAPWVISSNPASLSPRTTASRCLHNSNCVEQRREQVNKSVGVHPLSWRKEGVVSGMGGGLLLQSTVIIFDSLYATNSDSAGRSDPSCVIGLQHSASYLPISCSRLQDSCSVGFSTHQLPWRNQPVQKQDVWGSQLCVMCVKVYIIIWHETFPLLGLCRLTLFFFTFQSVVHYHPILTHTRFLFSSKTTIENKNKQ